VADSTTATLTFRDQSSTTQSLDLLLDHVRVTGPPDTVPDPTPGVLGTPLLSGSPGNITVSLTATLAGTYVLERSQDLISWLQIGEISVAAAGPIEFHDPQDGEAIALPQTTLFYRIGLRLVAE